MAVVFVAGLLVHLVQHLKYIKNIVKRWNSGISVKIKKTSRQQILLMTDSILVISAGFYAWAFLPSAGYHGTELRHHWIDVHNISGLLLLAGLTVHIKRRWGRMFARRAVKPLKAAAAAPNSIVLYRGVGGVIMHNPFGHHDRTGYIRADRRNCDACGKCSAACENGVLEIIDIRIHAHVHVRKAENCAGCMRCVRACPNGAINPVLKKAVNA
jgi:ferredoxin